MGGLLHDIGKVVQRSDDKLIPELNRNWKRLHKKIIQHSYYGNEYIKKHFDNMEQEILDQILYHHNNRNNPNLENAQLQKDSLAYITCKADSISSGADRRSANKNVVSENPLKLAHPLESVFNSLGTRSTIKYYAEATLSGKNRDGKIFDMHIPRSENLKPYDKKFYSTVLKHSMESLKTVVSIDGKIQGECLNSFLGALENYWTFVPASTDETEVKDISLYDHAKITAAVGCCLYRYLDANGKADYSILYKADFDNEKAFLLYDLNVTGIQDFIYTIHSDGALKTLRAKSNYLEILLENICDKLLDVLGLTRANLLFTGGGNAHFILPNIYKSNTELDLLSKFERNVNDWFKEKFGIQLYVLSGRVECSVNELNGKIKDGYAKIYDSIQQQIQLGKLNKYTSEDLKKLNKNTTSSERECKVCHTTQGDINDEGYCGMCETFCRVSRDLLNQEKNESLKRNRNLYLVYDKSNRKEHEFAFPLPFHEELYFQTKEEQVGNYIRAYSKNQNLSGRRMETNLWIGDYCSASTFEQLVGEAKGIKRMAVLRADVDNLGLAMRNGFSKYRMKNGTEVNLDTLSRRATLSRMLSLFFKYFMNDILQNGEYFLDGSDRELRKERNAIIVYSGGDDLFIVGTWDDIIGLAVDLRNRFKEFTQNKLSISAGIGIYPCKYPISSCAKEVGALEECSKNLNHKNGITLFSKDNCYKWDVFHDKVLEEKFRMIQNFFEGEEGGGKTFLFHLLKLLENYLKEKKPISLARFAFLLARLEPRNMGKREELRRKYMEFKMKMYKWMQNEEDAKQMVLAINIWMYLKREKEDLEDAK